MLCNKVKKNKIPKYNMSNLNPNNPFQARILENLRVVKSNKIKRAKMEHLDRSKD